MDGIMLVRGGRSSSASSTERSLLLGALANHMGVLDARENDAQTIIRKSELWDEITQQFNANTSAPRSRQQIQTLYKNMKAKARRYEARLAEVSTGVPPPDPDPISEMLLGLLHQQMQHQRRHLQSLVTVESHSLAPSGDDALKVYQHYDTNIVSPEQMMQVSLREGLTSETEIKNEPQDELGSPEDLPDGDVSATELFPGSVLESPVSQSTVPTSHPLATVNKSPQLLTTTSEHSQTPPHTAVPSYHQQTSTPTCSLPNHSTLVSPHPTPSSNSQFPKPLVATTHISPHSVGPVSLFTHPVAPGEGPMTHDVFPAAKKPRLEFRTDTVRYGGCGRLASRPPALCCCPDLHSQLLTLAQDEHHQRMKILKEDSELKAREHAARMRILLLEEEIVREKLKTPTANSDPADTPPASHVGRDVIEAANNVCSQ
ncbi:uncharacterized protein [Panulirus ornatus]|uniref:uncharacterized protein n=1 Tax=Panulirus ornatus TaxID=150431 RepID=UPI003A89CFCF